VLLTDGGMEHPAENIGRWIEALPDSKLRENLRSLFVVAEDDVQKFKASVEGWFNATMDRVSGWYKRFAQKWMILIGLALAVMLNVDTIRHRPRVVRQPKSRRPSRARQVATPALASP
jgi:hypothetical protein